MLTTYEANLQRSASHFFSPPSIPALLWCLRGAGVAAGGGGAGASGAGPGRAEEAVSGSDGDSGKAEGHQGTDSRGGG